MRKRLYIVHLKREFVILYLHSMLIIHIINYLYSAILYSENDMIKNNLAIDVKVKCLEEGVTQTQLAEKVGTSAPYISRLIKHPEGIINKTFVNMLSQLGYDIRLTYEPKENRKENK